MSLKILQFNWLGMCIGAGFAITTPVFKKNYQDEHKWQCWQLLLHLMGVQVCLTLPIWKIELAEASEEHGK